MKRLLCLLLAMSMLLCACGEQSEEGPIEDDLRPGTMSTFELPETESFEPLPTPFVEDVIKATPDPSPDSTEKPSLDEMLAWTIEEWLDYQLSSGAMGLIKPLEEYEGEEREQLMDELRVQYEGWRMMAMQWPATDANLELYNAGLLSGDKFGGNRITEDNKLAIAVVGGDEEYIKACRNAVTDPSILVFDVVEVSADDIWEYRNSLDVEEIEEKYGVRVYGCGIGYNCVTIDVDDPDKINTADFPSFVVFKKGALVSWQISNNTKP